MDRTQNKKGDVVRSVRFDAELDEKLLARSKDLHVSINDVVRMAVVQAVGEKV